MGLVVWSLLCAWRAEASDTYVATTGQLTIPSVVVDSKVYTNVVITVGNILAVGQGLPYGTCDSYDPATNELTIPSVQVGSRSYSNVLITVGAISQVGGSLPAANSSCQASPRNVLPMTVDAGPAGVINAGIAETNIPFVNVTVCQPGTTTCQTIDHVLVDTGSSGLRLISSVLNNALTALPQVRDGSGNALAECVVFASNVSWGAVRSADVQMGGETASAIPIQVIGDPALPLTPSGCASQGPVENTVASFGANGILGVSTFVQDCGDACTNAGSSTYYTCPPAGCQPAGVALNQQLPNPVSQLVDDNNGVVLALPAIPLSGTTGVTGTLTLGIGTQSNNSLGNAVIYDLDMNSGNFTTVYNGQTYFYNGFLDSGSNALFFADSRIPACSSTGVAAGFDCPGGILQLTATNLGATNGHEGFVNFAVANAEALFTLTPAYTAFSTLAGSPIAGMFDWGLPFFYGKKVFTAFERSPTPWGFGPYVAY
jgi:hypothetical protein